MNFPSLVGNVIGDTVAHASLFSGCEALPATAPRFKGAVGDGGAIESPREVGLGSADCPLPMCPVAFRVASTHTFHRRMPLGLFNPLPCKVMEDSLLRPVRRTWNLQIEMIGPSNDRYCAQDSYLVQCSKSIRLFRVVTSKKIIVIVTSRNPGALPWKTPHGKVWTVSASSLCPRHQIASAIGARSWLPS